MVPVQFARRTLLCAGLLLCLALLLSAPAAHAATAYDAAVTHDHPQDWWHLGEANAPYADSAGSISLNTGGGFQTQGAIPGGDAALAMANEKLGTTSSVSVNNSYSIEYWFKGTAGSAGVNMDDNYTDATRVFQTSAGGGAGGVAGFINWAGCPEGPWGGCDHWVWGTTPITDGNWHYLVFTNDYNAGSGWYTRSIYVDGILDGQDRVAGGSAGGTATNFGIGEAWGSTASGDFDELALYNYALPWTRIAAHYTAAGGKLKLPASALNGGSNPASKLPHASSGEPVDDATGNFIINRTDASAGGRDTVAFARTYNASVATSGATAGPLGYGWSFSYSDSLTVNGSTATVTAANGSTASFSVNSDGTFTPASWVHSTLVQNSDGSYTYTLPDASTEVFSSAGQLQSETDAHGNTATLGYTGSQLTSITGASGRKLTLAYNGSGQLASVTDPLGNSATYYYDSNDNLVKVIDIGGGEWDYGYDSQHRLTTIEDPRHNTVVTNTYDSQNRVTDQKDALNDETKWVYSSTDATDTETVVTDPNGNVTDYQFTDNLPTQVTTAEGTAQSSTTTTTYDGAYNPVQVVDGRGKTWTYTYDGSGNRLTATDPLNRTTTWTYDSHNNVTSVQLPSGLKTTYTYDSLNDVTQVSTPLSSTQNIVKKYAYTDPSHPAQVTAYTDSDNNTTTYGYNSAGDLTTVTDAIGNKTTYGYDNDGRKTSVVSPKGNVSGADPLQFTTTYVLDNYGHTTQVTDPLSHVTKYGYDADGNRNLVTDARTNTTTYVYDAANHQTEIHRADTSVLKTGYDAAGNMTSQTDGNGKTTTYTYDAQNRLATVKTPLGKTTSYGYDANGNQTTITDPDNRVTTKTYDAAGELTNISYSDGVTPNVTYTYTADGQRASMADGTGTTTYTYDAADRLQSVKNGAGSSVSYGLDLAGNATTITYPNSKTVTRTFDADQRLSTVTDWQNNKTQFGYDPNSNLTSTTYPDNAGTVDAIAYDNADQVSTITGTQGSSPLLSMAYTRNADGQVATESDSGLPSPAGETYTYNSLGQLTNASAVGSYAYDGAGNPTTMRSSNTLFYNADNELTNSGGGGSSWTFNNEGQRTADNWTTTTETYAYDQAGNLTSVQQPAYGTNAAINNTYTYDGDGNRMTLNQSGSVHTFTWDESGRLPQLVAEGAQTYIYGPGGRPLETIAGNSSPLFFHLDQQNLVRMVTTTNGQVMGSWTYDPYGRTLAKTGTAFTRLLYDGYWYESITNQFNLIARSYDTFTGQFMSRDPLDMQTRATYSYANDDPVNGSDPSGQFDLFTPLASAIGGVVGGVSGAVGYGAGVISGDHSFSVRGLAGATVGGAVGGAVVGGCVEGTYALVLAGCGAVGGAASTMVNNAITGQPLTSGVITGAAVGGAGNVIGGAAFPTTGMLPQSLRNLWEPGLNAQRLYGQAAIGGLASAFVTSAQATPGYADSLCGAP